MTTIAIKQKILDEIRRLTLADGKAPGNASFRSMTGIGKNEWYPHFWLRWSDAIREAGLTPNSFGVAFSSELLIKKYIELIRELRRFPIDGDLVKKRLTDKAFPTSSCFYRLGSKAERAKKILESCRKDSTYADVMPICLEVASKIASKCDNETVASRAPGYVYLFKHGSRREYKIGKAINPLRREGEIAIQLPEKLHPIHHIKTDDPSGVESYWHQRFKDKRK